MNSRRIFIYAVAIAAGHAWPAVAQSNPTSVGGLIGQAVQQTRQQQTGAEATYNDLIQQPAMDLGGKQVSCDYLGKLLEQFRINQNSFDGRALTAYSRDTIVALGATITKCVRDAASLPNSDSKYMSLRNTLSLARSRLKQLQSNYLALAVMAAKPSYVGISVQDLTPEVAKILGLDQTAGALIGGVEKSSRAALDRLRPGLVILSWGGQPVRNANDLRDYISQSKVGSMVHATIWEAAGVMHGGANRDVIVTVQELTPTSQMQKQALDEASRNYGKELAISTALTAYRVIHLDGDLSCAEVAEKLNGGFNTTSADKMTENDVTALPQTYAKCLALAEQLTMPSNLPIKNTLLALQANVNQFPEIWRNYKAEKAALTAAFTVTFTPSSDPAQQCVSAARLSWNIGQWKGQLRSAKLTSVRRPERTNEGVDIIRVEGEGADQFTGKMVDIEATCMFVQGVFGQVIMQER